LEGAVFRRFIIAIIAVAVLGIVFGATGASAAPYKWCSVGEATNCGFVTLEQCRAGSSRSCQLNPFYTGPDEKPAKRTRKPR
jgi:hypothetical protein